MIEFICYGLIGVVVILIIIIIVLATRTCKPTACKFDDYNDVMLNMNIDKTKAGYFVTTLGKNCYKPGSMISIKDSTFGDASKAVAPLFPPQ